LKQWHTSATWVIGMLTRPDTAGSCKHGTRARSTDGSMTHPTHCLKQWHTRHPGAWDGPRTEHYWDTDV